MIWHQNLNLWVTELEFLDPIPTFWRNLEISLLSPLLLLPRRAGERAHARAGQPAVWGNKEELTDSEFFLLLGSRPQVECLRLQFLAPLPRKGVEIAAVLQLPISRCSSILSLSDVGVAPAVQILLFLSL